MEEYSNSYYIKLNEENRVTRYYSTAFEMPRDGDVKVGEGVGSQFRASSTVLSEELQEFADIENGLPIYNDKMQNQLKYNSQTMKIEKVAPDVLAAEQPEPLIAEEPKKAVYFDEVQNKCYYLDPENNKVYI